MKITQIAESGVTVLCYLPVPENLHDAGRHTEEVRRCACSDQQTVTNQSDIYLSIVLLGFFSARLVIFNSMSVTTKKIYLIADLYIVGMWVVQFVDPKYYSILFLG